LGRKVTTSGTNAPKDWKNGLSSPDIPFGLTKIFVNEPNALALISE
jgi:hypothetical protein